MNSKIMAVIAVAILMVAGIGVILFTNNNDTKGMVETDRLVVFGNANNDDMINSNDRDTINKIISNEITWDKVENPFADTNTDGKIDHLDIELLDKIISKKDCTAFYMDYQNEAVAVDYPLKGSIGTMYYQQAQLAILLGLWEERVIACGVRSLSDVSSPGFENKFSYGDGYNVDPELVIESGVKTIICYTQTDTTAPDMKRLVESTGVDLNVLCINHEQLLKCVITYGFLFDVTDISLEYAKMSDMCSDSLKNSMNGISKEDQPSVALVMLYGTATTDKIRVLGYNPEGNTHNLAKLFNSVPNVNWERADLLKPSYGTYVTLEWFIENQPDYIVLVGSGIGATNNMSLDEVKQTYYNKCKEVFGETEAFKNGKIVCTSNGMMNGYSNPLVSLHLLSMVYDRIDSGLADKAYNTLYDSYVLHKLKDTPTEEMFYINKN